ncbi:MAG: formate/nitrite transporter family protein [Candidatus Electrothrix sp. AR4]|nr:formate/nitrite transporter family protein [Candidatus Electrothrix sp. AR4]
MRTEQYSNDAYSPHDIALIVERMGARKAHLKTSTLLILSILAGAYISIGALLFTVVTTDPTFGFGINRLLGGLSFTLGLILVVIGGAELFTGNNLLVMAWASNEIRIRDLFRNWFFSYIGNMAGALATVVFVLWADIASLSDGAVGETAVRIATDKANLTLLQAFMRGVLCNALVCLAIWLAMGGHSVVDKIVAIAFPIAAFVALGFEHSIANWFFLPFGMLLQEGKDAVSVFGAGMNLVMVTAGNLVGGSLQIAIYWLAYLHKEDNHIHELT